MLSLLKNKKIGRFDATTLIPASPISWLGVFAITAYQGLITDEVFDGSKPIIASTIIISLLAFHFHGRRASREIREGWLYKQPKKKATNFTRINKPITDHMNEMGKDIKVIEERCEQYRIFLFRNKHPKAIKDEMAAISMIMNVDQRSMVFVQNYSELTSAILAPIKDPNEWKGVKLNKDSLTLGKLIGYVGKSIKGEHVTYDRAIDAHAIIAGETGAGKTIAMRLDMQCMRLSGLNPDIYIFDPKNELAGEKCKEHTCDPRRIITILENLCIIASARMKKYTAAGCANYFEYQARIDETEQPIMPYIDELTAILKSKLSVEEKGDTPWATRAYDALFEISYLHRAAGVFLTVGIQKPKANIIPTEIHDNFTAALCFKVSKGKASEIVLDQRGAEKLQKQGGFLLKTSLTNGAPIMGRGAYI